MSLMILPAMLSYWSHFCHTVSVIAGSFPEVLDQTATFFQWLLGSHHTNCRFCEGESTSAKEMTTIVGKGFFTKQITVDSI